MCGEFVVTPGKMALHSDLVSVVTSAICSWVGRPPFGLRVRPQPEINAWDENLHLMAPIIASSYYQPSTVSAGKVIIGSLRVA